MATYQLNYRNRFSAGVVQADLESLARVTAGEFTYNGGSVGILTCPESYEWVIRAEVEGEYRLLESFTRRD